MKSDDDGLTAVLKNRLSSKDKVRMFLGAEPPTGLDLQLSGVEREVPSDSGLVCFETRYSGPVNHPDLQG